MASSNEAEEITIVYEPTPLSRANNHLGVELLKLLAKKEKNLLFSPLSLSTALAMLYLGAGGETSTEMRRVLGYDYASLNDDDICSSFHQVLSEVIGNPGDCVLGFSNSLLCREDFVVREGYVSHLSKFHKAFLLKTDFSTDSANAIDQINDCVKEKTAAKIPRLLESLDPSTVSVLLNSVHFKGNWLHQFDEQSTYLQCFFNEGEEENTKEVDMMHLKDTFFFLENESFKALQLPYKGAELAMLLLLPQSKGGLQKLEDSLPATFIQELREEMRQTKVEVELPKFRLEYSKPLKDTFHSMGLNQLFEEKANLSGISNSKKLEVSEIIHKAVITVNEEGSEAATASAVTFTVKSSVINPTFIIDHPFLFTIYDTRSDLILFLGKVEEL